jgi:hypothetical protein
MPKVTIPPLPELMEAHREREEIKEQLCGSERIINVHGQKIFTKPIWSIKFGVKGLGISLPSETLDNAKALGGLAETLTSERGRKILKRCMGATASC